MGLWDRLRQKVIAHRERREGELREHHAYFCTESFREILSAAKALRVHHGMNRTQVHFDDMLGYGLAERYTARSEGMAVMTAAILASHCGYGAVTMFVLQRRESGAAIGLHVSDDGIVAETALARTMTGTMDIYGLAVDYAASGEFEQETGPFRGPAQLLWDAGFAGIPCDDPRVEKAREVLARAALDPWSIRCPAKRESIDQMSAPD
jgi:hypothetical protein